MESVGSETCRTEFKSSSVVMTSETGREGCWCHIGRPVGWHIRVWELQAGSVHPVIIVSSGRLDFVPSSAVEVRSGSGVRAPVDRNRDRAVLLMDTG